MSRLDELIQQYCPDGVEYKSWEILQPSPVVAVFRKRISLLKDFLVFIMDKFIQDTVCLQRIHLLS